MRSLVVPGVALVAAMGCGGAQHFDASERATASSPRGDLSAEYEIGEPSAPLAEVKVWTSGAYRESVDGVDVTVIEVVFELENHGALPIDLQGVVLDSARARGAHFDDLPPFRVEGEHMVAPSAETTMRAYFALPDRYDPEDIERFEVGWSLRHDGGTYTQSTPFRQAPEYYAAYSHPGYYYDRPLGGPFGGPFMPGVMPPP